MAAPDAHHDKGNAEPLPRCCAHHVDWPSLREHLCRDFPTVPTEQVVRDLVEAKAVTERFGLASDDGLDVGELIVRYRLMLHVGEIADAARTDPQRHRVGHPSGEGEETK